MISGVVTDKLGRRLTTLIFDIVVQSIIFPNLTVAFNGTGLTDKDTTPAVADAITPTSSRCPKTSAES